jgi:chorismate mutase
MKRALMTMTVGVGLALCLVKAAPDVPAAAANSGPLTRLVDEAAQRLLTADPVAASKYLTGGAVDDPVREQQVLDSVTASASAKHIDANFVLDAFRDQIDATDSLEHSRFAAWKIDPGSAPKSAPDLSTTRDAINNLNETIVDEMAAQWNALQAATCPADLDEAKAAAIALHHFDPLYQHALDYAVHGYCR